MKKIAFIGAGKMAESLIARLSGYSIYAADVDSKRLAYLKKKYKINVAKDNQAAFGAADIVVLSVKPQQMSKVLADLVVTNKPLIISIAAGIPVAYLQKKKNNHQQNHNNRSNNFQRNLCISQSGSPLHYHQKNWLKFLFFPAVQGDSQS